MKNIKSKRLVLSLVSLLTGVAASAHAGMMDRWIRNAVNMSAVHVTIGTVQIVLCIVFFLIWKGCPLNSLLRRISNAIADRRILAILVFWGLSAFCLAPYLGHVDTSFLLLGTSACLISLILMACSLFQGFREQSTNPRCLFVLMSLALQQIIGYAVYFTCCSMDFFKEHFSYTDDEYLISNYYIYPDYNGIEYSLGYGVMLLVLFLIPMAVCIILELVARKRRVRQ